MSTYKVIANVLMFIFAILLVLALMGYYALTNLSISFAGTESQLDHTTKIVCLLGAVAISVRATYRIKRFFDHGVITKNQRIAAILNGILLGAGIVLFVYGLQPIMSGTMAPNLVVNALHAGALLIILSQSGLLNIATMTLAHIFKQFSGSNRVNYN